MPMKLYIMHSEQSILKWPAEPLSLDKIPFNSAMLVVPPR